MILFSMPKVGGWCGCNGYSIVIGPFHFIAFEKLNVVKTIIALFLPYSSLLWYSALA